MAGSGGPWGNDPDNGGEDDRGRRNGDGRGDGGRGGPSQIPEINDMVRKGTEHLRALVGGRGPRGGGGGIGGGQGSGGGLPRGVIGLGALGLVALWLFASVYTVKPEEKSVVLFLGKYSSLGDPGLNFAPWPFYTYEVIPVTSERTEEIGMGKSGGDQGLMLTSDENIVDIGANIVWNISDPVKFLFNLRDPDLTIRSVSESAMREIIAQSLLAPILNRDRGVIAQRLQEMVQQTLDSYESGIHIVRVNFDNADPPPEVISAFKEVQSAEQERDRLQKEADAYANKVVAGARGEAAQVTEEAEAYRAQVVNQAEGEASRFSAVLEEYRKAPDVTRERLYIENMQEVLKKVDKVILDTPDGGGGVLPLLPLGDIIRGSKAGAAGTSSGAAAATGGNN